MQQDERRPVSRHIADAGDVCVVCGAPLGDTLYRAAVRGIYLPMFGGSPGVAVAMVCRACAEEAPRYLNPHAADLETAPTTTCPCGRIVVHVHDRWLRREWCSRLCGDRERKRRLRVKDRTTVCRSCGRTFMPSRSDAVYCSSRCRQQGYRERRVTPTFLYLQQSDTIRNGVGADTTDEESA